MQKKLLKTSLFGFSKTEVCEYITRISAEFNEKIDTLNADHTKEKAELMAQISALNAEIDKYKQTNGDIAQALFDAQNYAAELKLKADDDYRAAAQTLIELKNNETLKLNTYTANIEKARKAIVALLYDIDAQLIEAQQQNEDLVKEYHSEEGMSV